MAILLVVLLVAVCSAAIVLALHTRQVLQKFTRQADKSDVLLTEASELKNAAGNLQQELRQFKDGGLDRLIREKLDLLVTQETLRLEARDRDLQQNRTELLDQQRQQRETVERIQKDLGTVTEKLDHLRGLQSQVGELNDLLKPQQLRGELGEVIDRNMISDTLPKSAYDEDYTFQDGKKVEFIIRLGGKVIPVDSKLQLEAFKRLKDTTLDDRQRQTYRNEFTRAVKQKIDEVKQYIRPEEGTYNFAMMVIPSEAVYYELIAGRDFLEEGGVQAYARLQRVSVCSPNTFWAYVSAIAQGLRGLEIEHHAEEILSRLQRIAADIRNFSQEEFRILGGHLRNATSQYEAADRTLRRIHDDLSSLERIESSQLTQEGVAA